MKKSSPIITYLAALAVGILLLVFSHEPALSKSIVIAIGVLFIVPSILTLITSLTTRRIVNGVQKGHPYFLTAVGAVGILMGCWLVFDPSFFISFSVYTLGVIMIVCGIASIVFVIEAAKPLRPSSGWYVMPVLTVIAGVVVCVVGPSETMAFAAIFSGCFLICYSIGGLSSLGRETKDAG